MSLCCLSGWEMGLMDVRQRKCQNKYSPLRSALYYKVCSAIERCPGVLCVAVNDFYVHDDPNALTESQIHTKQKHQGIKKIYFTRLMLSAATCWTVVCTK